MQNYMGGIMVKILDCIGWIFVCLFTAAYLSVFICGVTGEVGVCHVYYNMFNELVLEAFIIGLSFPFVVRFLWKSLKGIKHERL